MILRDLHTHTQYSDGAATTEQMVQSAIAKGLAEIGISDHSYTHFDESYCMRKDAVAPYVAEIAALKQKYAGKIVVRCGIEQDLYSLESTAPYEYAIGSVHYLRVAGEYYPIDKDKASFVELCRVGFGGDYYALAEAYFAQVALFAHRSDIAIIGHLDLIAKFNDGDLFDERHPRYLAAAKGCVDALVGANKVFEINTGAMSRGYRKEPYPAGALLAYIRQKGGKLVLSSDAHAVDTIAYGFEDFAFEGVFEGE